MPQSKHELIIRALVKDEVSKQIDKISGKTKKFGQQAEKSGKRAAAAFGKLKAAIVAVGGILIAKRIAREISGLGLASIGVARDVEEMRSAFSFTFRDMREEVAGFARDLSTRTQRSVFDIEEALTRFQLFFEPIGFAQEEAADLSKQMVQLGVDLGSLFNKAPQEAFQRLIQGLAGSTEATREIGIVLNETILRQVAFEKGITDTNRQLTLTERALAFVAAAYDRAETAIGDAERTSDSFANRMIGLEAAIREAKVEIGEGLIEEIEKAVEEMGGWEDVIEDIVSSIRALGSVAIFATRAVTGLVQTFSTSAPGHEARRRAAGGALSDRLTSRLQRRGHTLPSAPDRTGAELSAEERAIASQMAMREMARAQGQAEAAALSQTRSMAALNQQFALLSALSAHLAGDISPGTGRDGVPAGSIRSGRGGGGLPGFAMAAARAATNVQALAATMARTHIIEERLKVIGESFDFNLSSNLADAIAGVKSLSDAFKDFARGVLRDLALIGSRALSGQVLGLFGLPTPSNFPFDTKAKGGLMGGSIMNAIPVHGYAGGGPIFRSPHVAIVGEGSAPAEAAVPLPDGRSIPVDLRGGGQGGSLNVFIQAMDSQSMEDAFARRPDALTAVVLETIGRNPAARAFMSDMPRGLTVA